MGPLNLRFGVYFPVFIEGYLCHPNSQLIMYLNNNYNEEFCSKFISWNSDPVILEKPQASLWKVFIGSTLCLQNSPNENCSLPVLRSSQQ